jgi:UDP-apiose/xylose synthase
LDCNAGPEGSDQLKILILGAGGFIGSHMVDHLISRAEHDVVGVDITNEKLAGIEGENFVFHKMDVREENEPVNKLIGEADLVVDLVAHANPSLYNTTPLEVFDLNFYQNMKVLRMCLDNPGVRLVQYSSAEVYGKLTEGERYYEDESDSVFGPVEKQRWIYATSKVLLERVIHGHGAAGNIEYTIVRPFNFCGSRIDYLVPANSQGGPRVFAHFMSALLTGGRVQLVDGGDAHRTFLHIDDANRAFQAILDNPGATKNQIFNVGNPENNVTIRDLGNMMIELYEELTGEPSQSELVDVSGEEFYGEGYEDSDRLRPDITKIRSLGWEPKHDLRSTLRETMQYYLKQWTEVGESLLTS